MTTRHDPDDQTVQDAAMCGPAIDALVPAAEVVDRFVTEAEAVRSGAR